MSESRHTPGPWKYSEEDCGIYGSDGTRILDLTGAFGGKDNDLYLIEAAPELLDALKNLVQRVDINGGLGEFKGGPAYALQLARSAIIKAKREELVCTQLSN